MDYLACVPSLMDDVEPWPVMNTELIPDGHCMRQFEKAMANCEEVNQGPICDESSDQFNLVDCMKTVMTCVADGFRDFARCINE